MAREQKRPKFYVSEDVTADILSRLPVKSLLRFKCVCREWRTLISSPYFTSLHLNHTISNPLSQSILVYISRENTFIPFDPVTFSPRANHLNASLDQTCCFGDETRFVGSINGVLCICAVSARWVCLWNPSTRMFKKIRTGITTKLSNYTSIGFGFDPITNDYKVIVIYSRISEWHVVLKTGLKVWSSKSDSWKGIKVDFKFTTQKPISNVIVNEFAYWIVRDGRVINLIASFNMSTEELQLVPIPVPIPHAYPEDDRYLHYNGFIWKEKFALARFDKRGGRDQVWTLENDTLGNKYWSESFDFQLEFRVIGYPINFGNGKFVNISMNNEFILYDLETRRVTKSGITRRANFIIAAHYYVESLSSIKGFKRMSVSL